MAGGLWEAGKAGAHAAHLGMKRSGRTKIGKEVDSEIRGFFIIERCGGILEVKVHGRIERFPPGEHVEGKYYCAIAGKHTTDVQSESAEKCVPRRVFAEGRICLRRYDHFFSLRQDEPHKDQHGNRKQIWSYYIKLNG